MLSSWVGTYLGTYCLHGRCNRIHVAYSVIDKRVAGYIFPKWDMHRSCCFPDTDRSDRGEGMPFSFGLKVGSPVKRAVDRPLKATHTMIPRDHAHVPADERGLGTWMGCG